MGPDMDKKTNSYIGKMNGGNPSWQHSTDVRDALKYQSHTFQDQEKLDPRRLSTRFVTVSMNDPLNSIRSIRQEIHLG